MSDILDVYFSPVRRGKVSIFCVFLCPPAYLWNYISNVRERNVTFAADLCRGYCSKYSDNKIIQQQELTFKWSVQFRDTFQLVINV